jgi:hypothetical protein
MQFSRYRFTSEGRYFSSSDLRITEVMPDFGSCSPFVFVTSVSFLTHVGLGYGVGSRRCKWSPTECRRGLCPWIGSGSIISFNPILGKLKY